MRRAPSWGVLVVVVGLVTAGCTSSGDGDAADDTEVAGAVLERDDEGEPTAVEDPDDERVDPRETEPAEPDTDAEADRPADEQADGDDPDEGDADAEPASDPEPADDDPPSAPPDEGAPPAPPAPRSLAAGPGLRGDAVGFGPDGTEVLVGGPIDAPPAVGVRADAVRLGDADEVRCHSTLQAPQDRGLVARGELTVTLVSETHAGDEQRTPLLIVELEVELPAGERYELPATRVRAFDRADTASLSCETSFAPA